MSTITYFPTVSGGGGSGTVNSIVGSTPNVVIGVTDPANPTVGTPITSTTALTFFVDNDNGSDSANGTTSATPVKTFDGGLYSKIPPDGGGRSLTINCLPRAGNAIYKKADTTTNEDLNILTRLINYSFVFITGNWYQTGSVPSAGAVPATGTNSAGYDVTGSPTTKTFSLTLHGGGSAGMTTDALLGYRWRWDATTTTVALRNVTRTILGNGTDWVTMDQALGATPAAGDWGHVEMPGFAIGTANSSTRVALFLQGITHSGITASYFNTASLTFLNNGGYSLSNCWNVSATGIRVPSVGIQITGGTAATLTAFYAGGGVFMDGVYRPSMTRFAVGSSSSAASAISIANSGAPNNSINAVVGTPTYTIGDVPGSSAATTNSPSRMLNAYIQMVASNISVGRLNYEINYSLITNSIFTVNFVGQGNTLLLDGATATNYVGGLVDMAPFPSSPIVPSKGNTIIFGANQTSITGPPTAGTGHAAADIHVGQIRPVTGASTVQYTLALDTLTYAGAVTDGNGNRYISYANNGFNGGVTAWHGLWSPDVDPPVGGTVANDQGRFRVARATTGGLLVLADARDDAHAANIVGVNIDSLPDNSPLPVVTDYDRYGSPMIVSSGVIPIITMDVSPTVPGPVYLTQALTYPGSAVPLMGVVTTTMPGSGTVKVVGTAIADLGAFSETTQYPVTPDGVNPNTITGRLLRVVLNWNS